ncbi:TPA: hypothetical protein DF272_03755 [Candidatus Falkowbacteria bacterium]|nr:hypothetical protein [Candidatus Falkowbacteria bacterium]
MADEDKVVFLADRLKREPKNYRPGKNIITPSGISIPEGLRRTIDFWAWLWNRPWERALYFSIGTFHILMTELDIQPGDRISVMNERNNKGRVFEF